MGDLNFNKHQNDTDHITISDIANFLNTDFYGENLEIKGVASLNNIENNKLTFSKGNLAKTCRCKALILVPLDFKYDKGSICSFIKTTNPRLAFAKVLGEFFSDKELQGTHSSTIIGNNCVIDPTVSIGANCYIGNNVKIAKNTVINNNVVLSNNVIIGHSCYIKSGSIIGEDGFGFDFEENGTPVRIPHIGSVIIGNNVEIGAKNTIAMGTIDSTIIDNNVKIDDQVHIAHNCKIGKNTIITAKAEISGSVSIGENCWIGPNSSIIQKVQIGDNVTIGIGAIITKNIDSNKKIMGFESLELRELIKVKKEIKYGK